MVFSSSLFLFAFCPLFFICFFLAPARFKDAVIIIGSIFFYTWGANYFVLVVLATCLIDYKLGALIYSLGNTGGKKSLRRLCILADILINAGILLYFKYANFFADNVNALLGALHLNGMTFSRVMLPIGISFVIFQKMTYCLDIAKGAAKPAEHFFGYVEYLLLFPALIAGPILRYNFLAPQFDNKKISPANIEEGFKRFSVGLAKKVLIADTLAKYADIAFNGPAGVIPIHYAWIGIACYTLQIYYDFIAYSDMAIGMLKIMGFTIPENFNHAYISKSITEYWTRWHISLTSWMREYLYIPLGGNRKGLPRMYFNLWVVFLISGFWHGASWNYVVWGIYHGSLLCLERLFLLKKTERVPGFIRLIFTLFLLMVGFVFFRTETMGHSFEFLAQMFNFSSVSIHTQPDRIMVMDSWGKFILLLGSLMCILPFFEKAYGALQRLRDEHPKITLALCSILFFVAGMKVGTASFSPFIYFRF